MYICVANLFWFENIIQNTRICERYGSNRSTAAVRLREAAVSLTPVYIILKLPHIRKSDSKLDWH